jgi:phospholipid/cholesterol/gamma-HCH transport system ATP-binding protein
MVMYDEPFTGLDPISMGVIVKLIRDLNDAFHMTSVVVTHDVKEACSIADYIYLIGRGQVIAEGTPEQMRDSPLEPVKQFMQGLTDGPVAYHYPAKELVADLLENGSR